MVNVNINIKNKEVEAHPSVSANGKGRNGAKKAVQALIRSIDLIITNVVK